MTRERLLVKCRPVPAPVGFERDCQECSGYRNKDNYVMVRHRSKICLAHRVAYELLVGPIPDGEQIQHRCNNRACCEPSHLETGDHIKNMRYMVQCRRSVRLKGDRNGSRKHPERLVRGERHKGAKLTEAQVKFIRAQRLLGANQSAIARELGVSRQLVSQVGLEQGWKQVVQEWLVDDL